MRSITSKRVSVLLCVTFCVCCLAAAEADASSEQPNDLPTKMMLSVTTEEYDQTNEDDRELDPNTWIREFYRQSVLMVAREEFGMLTRDAVLGEPIDEESPDYFHLRVRSWQKGATNVVLRRGKKTLLIAEVKRKNDDRLTNYRRLSEAAAGFRSQIADALADAGFRRVSLPKQPLEKLPTDVLQLLQKMNHVSQFAALRRLHELLKTHGECPAILGGLVRGYAHMSQLTMPLVDYRYRGFGARSLVYAARLCELEPASAVGFWNRSYAMLWIGYPVGAQIGLNGARKRKDDADVEPAWVELIRNCLGYKFEALALQAENERNPHREQAALLRLLAARMTASDAFAMDIGEETRELLPASQRVITLMVERGGVSAKHELLPLGDQLQCQALRGCLADTEPPESLLELIPTDEDSTPSQESGLSQVFGPLFGSGDSADESAATANWVATTAESLWSLGESDVQEPSWCVLASNVRAWKTQNLFQRANFLRYSLGADATQFVNETAEQMDEEYRPLYRVLGLPRVSSFAEWNAVTRQVDPIELNNMSVAYDVVSINLRKDARTATGTIGDMSEQIFAEMDYLEGMVRRSLKDEKQNLGWVRWTQNVSENAPVILSALIRQDWENVAEDAEYWGEDYAECPDIQWALGKRHKHYGDLDKSIEYYERYVDVVADAHGYIGLSEAWYMKEKSDRWLEVLAKAYECEDHHLTHAEAAAFGGCTLMRDGRYEDALKWTERAAESYSHWGLKCHVECLTALGEFEEAGNLVRQMSMRYNTTGWYDWCLATGEGDLEAAWQAKLEVLRARGAEDDYRWPLEHGYHHLMVGDTKVAEKELLQVSEPPHSGDAPESSKAWCNLFAALLADRRDDVKTRDDILKRLTRLDRRTIPARSVATLAQWIYEDKGSGEISEVEAAELTAVGGLNGFHLQGDIAAALAFYLYSHDNKEAAVKLWSDAARWPGGWARNVSWFWLREAGVDPIHLSGRQFSRHFRRVQQKNAVEKI